MKTIVYNELNDELLRDWEDLWERSPDKHLFNSPAWTRSFVESYKPKHVEIIAVYERKRLSGVFPLIKGKCFGISCYSIPGFGLAHRSALLVDFSSSAVQILSREIIKLNVVNVGNLTSLEMGKMGLDGERCVVTKSVVPIMWVKGPKGKAFSVRGRSQIIKRARGKEKYLKLVPLGSTRDGLKKVFEIDMASSKARDGYNVFLSPEYRHFFERLVLHLGNRIGAFLLKYKNKPVAYELGFAGNGLYVDIERAYLSGHEGYTPGKVLTVLLAEHLSTAGFEAFDLGPGVDNFKRSLADKYCEVYDVVYSRRKIVRVYVSTMLATRKKVYDFIFKHRFLYTFYKKLSRS